jgi:hypothetical protein
VLLILLALASKGCDIEGEIRFGCYWKWMAKGIPKILGLNDLTATIEDLLAPPMIKTTKHWCQECT